MHLPPSKPRYVLYSSSDPLEKTWRFSICSPHGTPILEVSDWEPDAQGDRLALLPVVLGLEALEQPSQITLCTSSRYVQEGIRFGLPEWQANGWQWECFGQMVPVKNRDLWQRIERALRFHQVECRSWRFDPPHKNVFAKRTGPPERAIGVASFEPRPEPPADSNRLLPLLPGSSGLSSGLEKGCVSGSGYLVRSGSGWAIPRVDSQKVASQKEENNTHRADPPGDQSVPGAETPSTANGLLRIAHPGETFQPADNLTGTLEVVPATDVPVRITLAAASRRQRSPGIPLQKFSVPLQTGRYFFLVRSPSRGYSEESIGNPPTRRSRKSNGAVYAFVKRFRSLFHRVIRKVWPFLGKVFPL